jgi:hypothetical protein
MSNETAIFQTCPDKSISKRSNNRILDDEIEELRGEPERGRPAHIPTEALKGAVTMLCAFRLPQNRIASALGISVKILRTHYRHELDNAEAVVDAQVLTAWMKNVQRGKEMTILNYMQHRFFKHDVYTPPLPPATDEAEVTEETVRALAQKVNEDF